tara:strand:- start:1733 stop:2101 length:369 start_codon:yes stop_codon:yes gene_type:complete
MEDNKYLYGHQRSLMLVVARMVYAKNQIGVSKFWLKVTYFFTIVLIFLLLSFLALYLSGEPMMVPLLFLGFSMMASWIKYLLLYVHIQYHKKEFKRAERALDSLVHHGKRRNGSTSPFNNDF